MAEFEPPTYEEYKKANEFARFRYKYGMLVTFLCWIGLLFIIFYMVTNVRALSADPLQYAVEEMKLECHCIGLRNTAVDFFINSTDKWTVVNEIVYNEINLSNIVLNK